MQKIRQKFKYEKIRFYFRRHFCVFYRIFVLPLPVSLLQARFVCRIFTQRVMRYTDRLRHLRHIAIQTQKNLFKKIGRGIKRKAAVAFGAVQRRCPHKIFPTIFLPNPSGTPNKTAMLGWRRGTIFFTFSHRARFP